jgi:hypothetical protein
VIVNLDPTLIDLAKQLVDPVGHYSRPDLATLTVQRDTLKPVGPKKTIQSAKKELVEEPANENGKVTTDGIGQIRAYS